MGRGEKKDEAQNPRKKKKMLTISAGMALANTDVLQS